MPNLLVPDLVAAIRASQALKVYVCNTATQPGETDGYSVLDHVLAIERHTEPGLFTNVLVNARQQDRLPIGLDWVRPEPPVDGQRQMIQADLADKQCPWRHDADKLATALYDLLTNEQVSAPVFDATPN
jgi:uncharacterized cofD-like protein